MLKNVIKMKLKTNTSLLVFCTSTIGQVLRITLQDGMYLDLYREASLRPYRLNTTSS